ncbi:MAG: DUF58 domain-containing protein [Acidobacteriota bacterium]
MQRFLDPEVLAGISSLDLVAKTVVDGFISGLHESPDFGFSQEFAEYRQYVPGDDLRNIDWNVFARSDKMYIKRFKGETNTLVTVLIDASRSMKYSSRGKLDKLEYARFLAASVVYLAHLQRDATGLVVFDDEVRNFVAPSSRQGQMMRLMHAIDKAEAGTRTDFLRPFSHLVDYLRKRSLVVAISDFWEAPETVIKAVAPLRARGNELVLFHILDPDEIQPRLKGSVLLEDLETGQKMQVSSEYAMHEYKDKMGAHLEDIRQRAAAAGIDYFLCDTSKPLDESLRKYLAIRTGRL